KVESTGGCVPGSSEQFLTDQVLCDLGPTVTLVVDTLACLTWWFRRGLDHCAGSARQSDGIRFDVEIGNAQRFHGLLLRRHDSLEGWVPRFVDFLAHAHHCGEVRLKVRDALFRLTLGSHVVAVNTHFAGKGDLR